MTMNANDLFKAVMELNLDPIKTKLMHVQSGEGWSLEKVNAVEKEYRRFLCLMTLYPNEEIAPMVDVDTFWHYHILDTMKYAADCEKAFGYFLHHYPYLGMHGEDDEQARVDGGERMRTLYEATFGEAYQGAAADGLEPAYCAGPGAEPAYCAGPGIRALAAKGDGAVSGKTAYCAGPGIGKLSAGAKRSAGSATAYCAGPGVQPAYCAGPGVQPAYCAGPGIKPAYCAGPGAINVKTAYCAGPGAEPAYCAGPGSKRGTSRQAAYTA
jgi:hypothetical protein